jgi:hypothetical protein
VLILSHLLKILGPAPEFTHAATEEVAIWFTGGVGSVYGQLIATEFPAAAILGLIKTARANASGPGSRAAFKGDPLPVIDCLLQFASKPPHTLKVVVGAESVALSVPETEGDGKSAEDVLPADVSTSVDLPVAFTVDGRMFREAMAISPAFWHGAGKPLYVHSEGARVEQVVSLLF